MNTQEQIDTALNKFQTLEQWNKEKDLFEDLEIFNASHTVLGWFNDLANKTKKSDSNALKFKRGVNILLDLLIRYKSSIDSVSNYEKQAFYYRMKYESVIEQEQINDNLLDNVNRLLTENEQLKEKLKESENKLK